jgi:hypothetical protein
MRTIHRSSVQILPMPARAPAAGVTGYRSASERQVGAVMATAGVSS